MSENTTNPTEPDDTAQAPASPGDAATGAKAHSAADSKGTEGDTERSSANSEAAKYRRRLRDTEAERDTIATQRDQLARQLVETHLSTTGLKPAAFWALHEGLDGLLDDNGLVDPAAVAQAAHAIRDNLGIATGPVSHTEGMSPQHREARASWRDVVQGREERA